MEGLVELEDIESQRVSRKVPVRQRVKVREVKSQCDGVNSYEVVDPTGEALLPFDPGSHIDVHLPDTSLGVRQYSLCNDPNDRGHYRFAVQSEPNGRGGSKAIFELVRAGTELTISAPRNNFRLRSAAKRHILLAGGIGVTPMMAMQYHLRRQGQPFELHYCTRSAKKTAFRDELEPLVADGTAFIHWDNGVPSNGLNLKEFLSNYEDGTHLYYCGPPGFMAAVAEFSKNWPSGTTHREFFTPSANDPTIAVLETAEEEGVFGPKFEVKIASTGQVFEVSGDQTIVQVLRENGMEVETNCELGTCGTCRTRYLEGEPDHRDFVLEEDECETELLICCSRSKSPRLVLDL